MGRSTIAPGRFMFFLSPRVQLFITSVITDLATQQQKQKQKKENKKKKKKKKVEHHPFQQYDTGHARQDTTVTPSRVTSKDVRTLLIVSPYAEAGSPAQTNGDSVDKHIACVSIFPELVCYMLYFEVVCYSTYLLQGVMLQVIRTRDGPQNHVFPYVCTP